MRLLELCLLKEKWLSAGNGNHLVCYTLDNPDMLFLGT